MMLSAARAAGPASGSTLPPPTPPAITSMADLLSATNPSDWRPLDPENTLYLELAAGFAPHHVANVKALVREGYFDRLAIIRAQDNYVVQWGDPNAEDAKKRKPIRKAQATLPAEF